jgi:hypothetical protein
MVKQEKAAVPRIRHGDLTYIYTFDFLTQRLL